MLTTTRATPSPGLCQPRWATPRRRERDTLGGRIVAVGDALGLPFMPWQRQVAEVGGEFEFDGNGLVVPCYRNVVVTVPRQSGKTTLVLGWEIQRACGWQHLGPQRIAYSAQTGNDARKKLVEDQAPLLEPRKRKLGIRRILKGMGNEGVEFVNGSRLVLLASSEDSGHGKTIDLGVKDEYFADTDYRRDQALRPAMVTRRSAQVLTASTMGTDASLPLNELVDQGRAAVEAGKRSGIAYFEWSADPAEDIDDPLTWWRCMPALGYTITEDVIRDDRAAMPEGEFRRAYLNQRTSADERVIPAHLWQQVCDSKMARPDGERVFGLDANPERSAAAVVVADEAGRVEVVDHQPGLGWVAARVVELAERYSAHVAVDPAGPAAVFIPELEAAGVRVVPVSGREMAQACAGFFDDVAERSVMIRPNASLDAAVAAAVRRHTGDAWVWARRGFDGDVCPLVAATIALWVARSGAYDALESVW